MKSIASGVAMAAAGDHSKYPLLTPRPNLV